MIYCVDTSSFIGAWARHYPIDLFPTFWNQLDKLISSGSVISTDLVKQELERRDDDLYKWVKLRENLFQPLDLEIQSELRIIMKDFPHMVKAGSYRNAADPFVVALAKARKATVVSEETPGKQPKIPTVCDHYSIPCLSLVSFMRANKFTFS